MEDARQVVHRPKITIGWLTGRLVPVTLKGRLLAIFFGVVLPSLATFGVLHHDMLKRSLLNEVDENLLYRAHEIVRLLEAPGVRGVEDLERFRLESAPLMRFSAPEVYSDLVNLEGRSLWTSENLAGSEIPIDVEGAFREPGFSTNLLPDGLKLRTYTQPHLLADGNRILVVVAESLSHLDKALQSSIGRSLLLGLVILVLTGGMGAWAIRGAFAPLESLVSTAERIVSTDDVSQRVHVGTVQEDHIRRTGEAFNALMDRMEHLLGIAKQLLADTSHELRNPLTVLMTDLDMLRQDLAPDEREEVINEAEATVQRMTRLVRDLLLLSRIEAHSEQMKLVPTNAFALTTRVANRLAKGLRGGDRIKVQPLRLKVAPLAMIHAERTEQILTNLIENAIFYSQEGSIEISVDADPQGPVIISVRDYGCGISAEEQPKLFERFFRIDPSRNRSSGGTGLGLPVARALARAQKGDILVESQVDVGSCFRVLCPLAGDED